MLFMRYSSLVAIIFLLCLQLQGCGPRYVPPPEPVDQGSFLVHRVASRGESVSAISSWYTGSEKHAKLIAKANGLAERALLKVGQRILIPSAVVKKSTPLPKVKAVSNAITTSRIESDNRREGRDLDVKGDDVELSGDDIEWQVPKEQSPPFEQAGQKLDGATIVQPGLTANPDGTATVGVSGVGDDSAGAAESFEAQLLREQSEVERLRREMQSDAPTATDEE